MLKYKKDLEQKRKKFLSNKDQKKTMSQWANRTSPSVKPQNQR